ncbi:hypothetical protein VSDG_00650 [Cytospora chrysosperma]|uniref:Mid2 domain-containing protein n=1 Tax=Cytospora chrysosperma TaxID=252740 RepID=A0A423WNJ4_CYTCH|nr:hypothetical protein VSDG_00650 [Valsa sordida]
MRVPSKFATAVLAMALAQPVMTANWEPEAPAPAGNDEDSVDLRPRVLYGRSRWQVREEIVQIRAPATDDTTTTDNDDDDDSNADDAQTTLSTSTTSDALATTTSQNTWVMVQHVTGTSYSTITCMTPTTVATSACSYVNDKTTACASTTAVIPTCVPGMLCSFSQDNGAVSCVTKGGMHPSGFIVVAVLGLAAAVATTVISILCCRDHRSRKAVKKAAEARAAMLAAAEVKKAPRVEVAELGGKRGDHVPLMGSGPNTSAATQVPGIAQEQRYGDPFEDGRSYYGRSD